MIPPKPAHVAYADNILYSIGVAATFKTMSWRHNFSAVNCTMYETS